MAENDFNIRAIISANTSQFERGMKTAQTSLNEVSKNITKVQQSTSKLSALTSGVIKNLLPSIAKGGAIGLGIAAITKGFQALNKTVKESIALWEQAKNEQALLEQTLRVTGAETWTNIDALNAMADAYQRYTNYSSGEINQMQTILLGFKNITGDTFESASDAILDMATVMKMDLTSAAQTVAKALDDPINGVGSLSRQGFKFSEAEKEMIKNLVEAGNAAQAQKIILDELNTTYGGAAEEGVKASKQLKNNWDSVKEEFGHVLSVSVDIEPALKKINTLLQKWKDAQNEMATTIEQTDRLLEAREAVSKGSATNEQRLLVLKDEIDSYKELIDEAKSFYEISTSSGDKVFWQNRIMNLTIAQGKYVAQRMEIEKIIAAEEEAAEEAKKRADEEQAVADREAAALALKAKYTKEIEKQKTEWARTEKLTGEAIKAEEKRDFYVKEMIKMLEEGKGLITEENDYYKQQAKIIEDLNKKIKEQNATKEENKKKTADVLQWEDKLQEQQISKLEAIRDLELKRAKNAQEEYAIRYKYGQEIYALQLQELEIEKERELAKVKNTQNAEEARLKIIQYYSEQERILRVQNAEQNAVIKQEEERKSAETWEEIFSQIKLNIAKEKQLREDANKLTVSEYNNLAGEINDIWHGIAKDVGKKVKSIGKNIGDTFAKAFSKVANIAKSMFQGGVSIFSKLFNIDVDTALDAILKIEDKVLSFFVETLPRLPQFVASVMQSISVLLESVLQVVTPEKVSEILINIMNTIIEYGPTIIGAISDILGNMIDGMIEALPQILDALNVIVQKLAEELPTLIQKLIDFFIAILQEPDKIAKFVVTLIKGFVEIFNVLLRNIGPLLEALLPAIGTMILEIIKAIPDILATMAEAIGEALKGIGKFIVNALVDILNLMFDGISKAWTWIPGTEGIPHIPKLATGTDNAQRGIALVGEAGPELVRFNGGEQVLNNRNTQKALAGISGSSNEFTVNFYNTKDTSAFALVSQFKQYNRELAINGVL